MVAARGAGPPACRPAGSIRGAGPAALSACPGDIAGPPTRRSGGARSSARRPTGLPARSPAGPVRDAGPAVLLARRTGAVGRLLARTRPVRAARINASVWEIMTSPAGTDPHERRPDSTQ